MKYHEMYESFGILSDWCANVEEILATSDNRITVRVDLKAMNERDLSRLIELGWETNFDYNWLHLNT